MAKSFFEEVLIEFARALEPLEQKLTTESFPGFMLELGWDWPEGNALSFGSVVNNLTALQQSFSNIDASKPFSDQISQYTDLAAKIKDLVVSIYNMATSFPSQLPATIPADVDFKGKIGIQVFDYLVCTYLKRYKPIVFGSLTIPGIIERKASPYSSSPLTDKVYLINWSNLGETISDFSARMKQEYNWGSQTQELEDRKLLDNIEEMFLACGVPVGQRPINERIAEKLYFSPGESIDPAVWEEKNELNIPIYEVSDPDVGFMEAGLTLLPVPDKSSADKASKGFALSPYVDGALSLEFNLTENLILKITSVADTEVAITVLPGKVDFIPDLFNTGTPFSGEFKIELVSAGSADKIVAIGTPEGSRLEYQELNASFQLKTQNTGYDLVFETEIKGASIVLQAANSDGFLQKILPSSPITVDFDFGVGLSRARGIYFKGGAGLQFSIPINESLGPITIISIDFDMKADGNGISLVMAVSGKAAIGPATALVKKIGMVTRLEFNKPGILGNTSLSFGFKPPEGVGLNLDIPGVSGGGFLEIEDGNYAGILYIDIQGAVTITVIGILTTKLPDGSKIFSLKILGFVEFPPVQLGLGFILKGIGICAAIECAMNTEALRNSVYSGSLNSILFPPDPIKNAQKIIADLKSFFPPKEGSHVFGVAVKLGWGGAKALVQADLGIFVQVGGPLRIALAGMLYVRLPNPDAEENNLLILQMQAIGIIDFGDSTVSVDASLTGSRILTWPIEGDMALRTGWGDNKRFALSVGGFFPGYKAPEDFPSLRRLSISLGKNNPRIGLSSYFAVTENSIQFGAELFFHYEKDVTFVGFFELDGKLGLDVLFKFMPFSFETNMCACLSLKRDGDEILGVDLRLYLSGPNNYHAQGSAKFKVCGFKISVDFDKRFGQTLPDSDSRQVISPLDMLLKELDDKNNWSIIAGWGSSKVVFKPGDDAEQIVDTFGGLCFRQKSIPLLFKLKRFGQADITPGQDYFDIDGPSASQVEDSFSPAQFAYLLDSEKTSAPPFEDMKSGLQLSSKKLAVPGETYYQGKTIEYETKFQPKKEAKKLIIVTGVSSPASLAVWQKAAGHRYHTSPGIEPPEAQSNRIVVSEPKYTLVSPDGRDGRFERATRRNGMTYDSNLTYAQTRQRKADLGTQGVEILPVHKAVK